MLLSIVSGRMITGEKDGQVLRLYLTPSTSLSYAKVSRTDDGGSLQADQQGLSAIREKKP